MKICFVLTNSFFEAKGGAELQALLLAKYFSQRDHDVYYLYESKENETFEKEGITLFTIKTKFNDILKHSPLLSYPQIKKILDKIDPDIIYQRGGNRYRAVIGRYCNKNAINFVYGISSNQNCRPNHPQKINKLLYGYINEKLKLYGIRRADLIIAQHQEQRELLKKNYGLDSIVIPNCHNVPEGPFKKINPPMVTWIANIKRLKQPEIFLKLAEKLRDLKVTFLLVGRPSEGKYQKSLEGKINSLPNTRYLGEIPFEETNQVLSKSSIFVNTSEPKEGFPNTYVQAWMRETPVVSLNFDPSDILKRKELGFHSKNFDKLVKDVRYLINNIDVRKKMGERAREYAIEHHDIKNIGKKYLKLFKKI